MRRLDSRSLASALSPSSADCCATHSSARLAPSVLPASCSPLASPHPTSPPFALAATRRPLGRAQPRLRGLRRARVFGLQIAKSLLHACLVARPHGHIRHIPQCCGLGRLPV